ncbi:MAG: haloacid dehalogenase, partial [Rhodobacter sp.]|nr:haloacid dehalogenase [Rhodobacter sp.]
MPITTCVFDAYGTLFDVAAAARECAAEPGRAAFAAVWPKVANDWRLKQLQYSWLRAIADAHTDFWEVTQNGLDFALEASNLHNDPELRERLLALYWELSAYPEVPAMLAALKAQGLNTAILSNG